MPGARISLQFISAEAGGRTLPTFITEPYRPHLRVADGEYLGVAFVNGSEEAVVPGVVAAAEVVFMYSPQVNYEPLKVGTQFQVLEGQRIVGVGIVKALVK